MLFFMFKYQLMILTDVIFSKYQRIFVHTFGMQRTHLDKMRGWGWGPQALGCAHFVKRI
jgi:hypothetical protein